MVGFDPEKITFFAKTDARGQQVPFGIKAKDRQRHMYVIGKTGMGKSTLLENMAAQDIQNGEGMAFIDPHGSAIEVLLDYIPEDRLDDVVYFAPFDMENPVAFNIMEDVGVDTRHLVVSGLMSTFKKIWEDAWSARMEYILTNALLALIEYPGTTLLSVNRMLADKEYRDKVIENVKDPAVKAYWIDEFNNYTERFAAEALPAIQNKIGQFTGNPLIRNIIGQPKSSFDVRKMMDEKKILLINLSKGLVGETNADLIGSMLITKIYLAAMSRAELPPSQMKQMPNFYFYVDEFQSFANSTFANILSEARKYHLNLIIAHQYVAQMEEKIRDAVFGNVGTTVAFRTGPFDAEVLETVFAPQFEAVDLVNLGMYQVCLTLMIDGVGSPPFSAITLPPVETPATSHKHMAIKRSQQNYSKPRAEVEQLVVDSHAPTERLETAVEKGNGNKGGFTKPSGFLKVGTDKDFVEQKERLKNGGSRQKGPAQTPPGTAHNKQGNGNSNDAQRAEASRKPRQPEKTPDDLRAILAGMVDKKEDAPKRTEEKSNQPKRADRNGIETQKSANSGRVQKDVSTTNRNRNERTVKPRQSEQTPEDLKAVLAKMTGKLADQKTETQKSSDRPQKKAQARSQSQVAPRTSESLQTALADVLKKSNQTQSSKPRSQEESAVTKKENKPNSEHKPELKKMEVQPEQVTQSPEPAVGGVRKPAFEVNVPPAGPDAATVKQMLKTSGKDRPPGM